MTDNFRSDPNSVKEAILNPEKDEIPEPFTLSLTDFKSVFQEIQKERTATKVDIVLNGFWALVQFPELCNHRIRILPDAYFHPVKRFIRYHQYLEEKDFEIAASVATFYGQTEYLTLPKFIKEEFEENGFLWIVIFTVSIILLYLTYSSTNSITFLETTNDILIQISAIFFSIFMLFTASQNFPKNNMRLFAKGNLHRFMRVDILVAWFSIFTLGISSINKIISSSTTSSITQTVFGISIIVPDVFIPFTTALAVTSLTMSLVIVVQYYFKRVEHLQITDLSKEILDNSFKNTNLPIEQE